MRVIVFPCLTGSKRVNAATRSLTDKVRRLCATGLCEYRELDELLGQDGRLSTENTLDDTHLTAQAYRIWVASVRAALTATR
jgi:lysophospholipase L1-like esterase